jgi:hypothetical protein
LLEPILSICEGELYLSWQHQPSSIECNGYNRSLSRIFPCASIPYDRPGGVKDTDQQHYFYIKHNFEGTAITYLTAAGQADVDFREEKSIFSL